MNPCQRCGLDGGAWITHVCPPPGQRGDWQHSTAIALPMRTSLPSEMWAQIVFAAKESSDARLAQMIEQAVMEARVV